MLRLAASVVAGYLVGNVSTADLVTRRVAPPGTDLRHVGSGNPGGLNAGKQLGARWGAAVAISDVAKGVVASALGRALAGPSGANYAAAAAVAGHCHPVGRTGGKGVATSIGQVIGTFPRYLPLDIAVAVATAAVPAWKQRTFGATAVASTVWTASATLAWARRWPSGTDSPAPGALPVAAAVSSAIIVRRFAGSRLIDGKPA